MPFDKKTELSYHSGLFFLIRNYRVLLLLWLGTLTISRVFQATYSPFVLYICYLFFRSLVYLLKTSIYLSSNIIFVIFLYLIFVNSLSKNPVASKC